MTILDNLKKLFAQQKKLTDEFENAISELDKNDFLVENAGLKKEVEEYKSQLDVTKKRNSSLESENKKLKNSLYEQLYNEKIAILNAINKKIDSYYNSNVQGGINRLKEFELNCKNRIDSMKSLLRQNMIDSKDELYSQINEVESTLNSKILAMHQEIEKQSEIYLQNKNSEYDKLHQERVSEEEAKSALKKNNLESLIGLNILNKVGIFFLIIGVIAAVQFTYVQLPNISKCIFAFVAGMFLLVSGEFLNAKKPNIFSLGITSGGVAVLYVALSLSYFQLKVIGMSPAIILCILITALAFILSQRYNSRTIAAFAQIGGYIPIFSIVGNKSLLLGAMVYFVILNLLALIISSRKKWTITTFIGFALNLFGSIYIASNMFSLPEKHITRVGIHFDHIITIAYIFFAFLIYTLIPLVSSYFEKIRFKSSDITLLALNTFFSAVLLYSSFYSAHFSKFTGLLAVIFAVTYLLLGKLIKIKLPEENEVSTLFNLTSLAFVVLIVPFQFDKTWLSLGWLIEGVIFLLYGVFRNEKIFRICGSIICGLCFSTFFFIDVIGNLIETDDLFVYKYFAITLASILTIAAYKYKKALFGSWIVLVKNCTLLNLWFFMIYMVEGKLPEIIKPLLDNSAINTSYLIDALAITLGLLIAYIVTKIKGISDSATRLISIFIYSFSIIWLFVLNSSTLPAYSPHISHPITILGTVILISINLLSILAVSDLVKYLVLKRKLSVEWYPLIVSAYFVLILTQNLISQYNLEFTNFIISVIYIVASLSWIIFGFIRKYSFIRHFGLALVILSIAKLFFIDLSYLSESTRIISYFIFGVILLAISFVYQYFNKRIEC